MIELLRRAAAVSPDGVAVVESASNAVTYRDLLNSSERLASAIAAREITSFGIASTDAAQVLGLLGAASLVGARACVLPPVDLSEALVIADRFDLDVVVAPDVPAGEFSNVLPLAELELAASEPMAGKLPAQRRHLVLTTGSTGTPKGIVHDWSRLTEPALRVDPDRQSMSQKWLLAYGVHQFGGLQVLLHVCAVAATLVAPVPRRPAAGLAAMREFGVTHASATPTYWRFLMSEMRADGGPLPALEQITMGGEASSPDLLDALRGEFPQARITQVYAATEFGAINVSDGLAGLPLSLLDDDNPSDVQLRIDNGELLVRSRVGMIAEYGRAAAASDGWRPTGDLVEVVDGRIRFRGRTSEVINVGGVKVHPLPVEERVTATAGVQAARVFGRSNALTGMVVAVELVVAPGFVRENVIGAVRNACQDLAAEARPRSVRAVDEIASVGGKIVRRTV
ncbi:class I adenylate-forming enzyme family protein [Smaragdicoccus niigatensis]|uniref:class I adenylate-forming enzyme family protein n=1 Tax=Smaragdicoccus niigatensis TaxID=359359 RepID=UPI0003731007|nr:class I adenylate-forming enzyme family protein [Smaragdicoccus niigatensis]